MIVTLSNTVAVNPLHVADLVVDDEKNRVTLHMADGRTHSLPCQYGKSIWATRDEMVAQLNGKIE